MGVFKLRKFLEPYSETFTLESGSAILDGPSFAYHIFYLCSRTVLQTTPFEQPSYELLGRTAISWLTAIRSHGYPIAAIYFDGYLPSTKRPERIRRLLQSTQNLVTYHAIYPSRVPAGRPGLIPETSITLFPNDRGIGTKKLFPRLPNLPFIVPAIIDALRLSPDFSSTVNLAPGEADGFCAHHAREHGGTIFTSDSDLLAYNLGRNGSVVFFDDMNADQKVRNIKARRYSTAEIAGRLSLNPDEGLQELAFAVANEPNGKIQRALDSCKGGLTDRNREKYLQFVNSFLTPNLVSTAPSQGGPPLDPRLSELIFRSPQGLGSRPLTPTPGPRSKANKNGAPLEMYLPFLLSCPSRATPWEASTSTRQLAYAALQIGSNDQISSVMEMRRLQTASKATSRPATKGSPVEVPDLTEIDSLATSLLELLSIMTAAVDKNTMVWALFAVYQDISLSIEQGKQTALSLELLLQIARGRLDVRSWEFVHLLAQTQASYYSLRMLHQMLGVLAHSGNTLSEPLAELFELLPHLPSLLDFPTLLTFPDILQLVREGPGLSVLEDLFSEHEDVLAQIEAIKHPQDGEPPGKEKTAEHKKKQTHRVSKEKVNGSKGVSSNRFDLLMSSDT
ncbi:XPG domain containing-domain-containing protein [Chaetomium sp. MPI-SDFR-AT-0129]|nr:XPG domain containing-domain-containing protein [Chaetomium sp. MPI-SDFR-AT-0129]